MISGKILGVSPQMLLENAVANGVFPGASACCARGDDVLFHGAAGTLGVEAPFDAPATTETIYDLASVTKLYILAAALQCLRAHQISIHAPLREFLPAFDARLTLARLMNHSSGLRLHLQTLRGRPIGAWLPLIAAAPLETPGESVLYACTNYFLLGRALVAIEGAPLERIVEKYLLEPGNLRASFAPDDTTQVAPTERDEAGVWVCAQVHDEAAREFRASTGDCAGNAGLFSDCADVAAFSRLWFDDFFHPADLSAIDAATLPESVTPQTVYGRGLGFQIDAPFYMSEAAPRGSWGHLGFTGPSLVLHRASRSVVAMLNNRVHPTRVAPNRLPTHRALAKWSLEANPALGV